MLHRRFGQGRRRRPPGISILALQLIFAHVQKAAGTSLRLALERKIGGRAIYLDGEDQVVDPSSSMHVDPQGFLGRHAASSRAHLAGARAVFGHFWIRKYDGLSAYRMTVLREPVSRALSHYFYWKTIDIPHNGLWKRFMAENMSVLDFCALPTIGGLYSNVLFKDDGLKAFDHVGVQDRLAPTIARMEAVTGVALEVGRLNENTYAGYAARKEEILADARTMAELRRLLQADISLYERAYAAAEAA